jgi:hypothetical protein
MTEENIKNVFDFCDKIAENEQNNYRDLFVFINKFSQIYDKEEQKLPYRINLIDELHANENAHSRILEKLLNQKTNEGKYELLESFIEYLKEKGKEKEDFSKIKIGTPKITQEKERIDLWIRDESYSIIIENKIHNAQDQTTKGGQIFRYIETTKQFYSEDKIYVIYIPPTYEKKPEQQSWGKYFETDIYNKRYLLLSFRDDIIVWLKEKVLPNIRLKDVYLRSAIEQYIDHLEGIFSLRTINNTMNMELQKFIESELKLSEQEPIEALDKISEKEKALTDAITQLNNVKSSYIRHCFPIWEEKLKKEFPNYNDKVKSYTNKKGDPGVGIIFSEFSVIIEYNFNGNKKMYYGIKKKNEEDDKINDDIQSIVKDYYTEKGWYGWDYVDYKDADKQLIKLINSVLEVLSQE